MDFGFGIAKAFARYAEAYMRQYFSETPYTEIQCGVCPFSHGCCKMLVFVTPLEVAAINNFINTRVPPHVVKRVKKVIIRRARMIRTHFAQYGDESEGVEAWFHRDLQCIFYDKPNRECAIYEVRPLACRKLYSVRDCAKLEWSTHGDRAEVIRRRIEILPHYDRYEQNLRKMSLMLEDMMGEKQTRIGLPFHDLIDAKKEMDDLDIINPVEKKLNEGVDSSPLVS